VNRKARKSARSLSEDMLFGRNAVYEVLRADRRRVGKLIVAKTVKEDGILAEILQLAAARQIPVERLDRMQLDDLSSNHQGVVAQASPYPYVELEDILKRAREAEEPPLLLLLDILQDPQNMGTLLRTAVAAGVHGVVIPPRHSVGVTPGVVAASAGTCEHLLIATTNIAGAIRRLKDEEFWVLGLEHSAEAQVLETMDLSGALGLVIGGEAKGMRRLVRESCDALVRIPMRAGIDSLNAAVAGSIALYAIWRTRGYAGEQLPS
jgi:23S rRNA (guanosine2251-2'-O)-methyltransferase